MNSTLATLEWLDKRGQVLHVHEEVDPNLEMAEIQRRVYAKGGPALWFENVKGCSFPCASNLYGSTNRVEMLFESSLMALSKLGALRARPQNLLKKPWRYLDLLPLAFSIPPLRASSAPVLANTCNISDLPQIKSWPMDGGAYITLPQVISEDSEHPGIWSANMGMYRVQLSGEAFLPNREIGMHYQIHRGIGVHHSKTLAKGKNLKVTIAVGGPPAHAIAAVMPLPEGMGEALFAGALGKRNFRWIRKNGWLIPAEADFVICGTLIGSETRKEGPFGDHLGYYSLAHDFPLCQVEAVYHRDNAIWPFTVVGRPPQEDSALGDIIHKISGPMIPKEIPGLVEVHAVDAAGVHPLLLALGNDRYVPFDVKKKPLELFTLANAVLGFGQLSLAKVFIIADAADNPKLRAHNTKEFLIHSLERVDWTRNLLFHTRTTMDTLDYTGGALNLGSKAIIVIRGEKKRELRNECSLNHLPEGMSNPKLALPGVVVIQGNPYQEKNKGQNEIRHLCQSLETQNLQGLALVVVVDDADFCVKSLNNFLWVTFTRANPAVDFDGVQAFVEDKHWGCKGPLVIDARIKPHHAPPLIEDPKVRQRVDELGLIGKSLHGWV